MPKPLCSSALEDLVVSATLPNESTDKALAFGEARACTCLCATAKPQLIMAFFKNHSSCEPERKTTASCCQAVALLTSTPAAACLAAISSAQASLQTAGPRVAASYVSNLSVLPLHCFRHQA